ncbi:DUF4381 domain-containing protein [Aliiruegeria lutimaris]|uniref:DUF4381 domain-containing protein n=1 Tax=Aliiruegeria lutimaris TaxID=571298 RepID=A0A1G8KPM4_9RHOB|nr:DUF4381 domain-containing protein [Aliiruegeria lutimaris]SDI45394.1 protein of unknown function [Aliiruegeria lutimaris]
MADLPETDGKNLVEMLDMLKPIPEPEPISMIPATSGWIWLGLAVIGLLCFAGYRARRYWNANAYRRAALAELARAGDKPEAIAAILRRAALVAYPRADVASLTGPDWCAFLDKSYGGDGFSGDLGAALTRAPWREVPTDPAVTALARRWLKSHKPARRVT